MEIDLTGKTVTQSLESFEHTLQTQGGTLIFKIDNETVKLNLMQLGTRLGHKCHSKRAGSFWMLTLKVPEKTEAPKPTVDGPTSFPQARKVVLEWWILQSDQFGQKDHQLGRSLIEDFLLSLMERPIGLFFLHRSVLLLNEPGLLKHAQEMNTRFAACPRSLAFYKVNAPSWIERLEFNRLYQLNRKAKLNFL